MRTLCWMSLMCSGMVYAAMSRPLQVSVEEPTLVRVEVDAAMWEVAEGEVGRLVIRDEGGGRVPVLRRGVRDDRTEIRHRTFPASLKSLQPLPGNRLELICEVQDVQERPVHGIEFDIPMRDFEKVVRVWGLGEDGGETLLVDQALLVDYHRYADVRNTRVVWEEGRFRRFRVQIEEAVDDKILAARQQMVRTGGAGGTTRETWTRHLSRPLRIDGVKAVKRERVRRTGNAVLSIRDGVGWTESTEPGDEVRTFDWTPRYQPVTQINLRSPDPVFRRSVEVQIPALSTTGTQWRTVTKGTLSKLVYRDTREEDTTLSLSAVYPGRLRLRMDTDGMRPIEVEDIQLSGPVWEMVFLAGTGMNYRLELEDRAAVSAAPQVERLLKEGYAPVPVGVLPAAEAADVVEPFNWGEVLKSRAFFSLALLVAGGVIAVALLRAVKQVE